MLLLLIVPARASGKSSEGSTALARKLTGEGSDRTMTKGDYYFTDLEGEISDKPVNTMIVRTKILMIS
jgi:hypothetical protein